MESISHYNNLREDIQTEIRAFLNEKKKFELRIAEKIGVDEKDVKNMIDGINEMENLHFTTPGEVPSGFRLFQQKQAGTNVKRKRDDGTWEEGPDKKKTTKDFSFEWNEYLSDAEREEYREKAKRIAIDKQNELEPSQEKALMGLASVELIMDTLLRNYQFETFFVAKDNNRYQNEEGKRLPIVLSKGEKIASLEETIKQDKDYREFITVVPSKRDMLLKKKKTRRVNVISQMNKENRVKLRDRIVEEMKNGDAKFKGLHIPWDQFNDPKNDRNYIWVKSWPRNVPFKNLSRLSMHEFEVLKAESDTGRLKFTNIRPQYPDEYFINTTE